MWCNIIPLRHISLFALICQPVCVCQHSRPGAGLWIQPVPPFPALSLARKVPGLWMGAASTWELQERMPVVGQGMEAEHSLSGCCWRRAGLGRMCLCIFISPLKYAEEMITGSLKNYLMFQFERNSASFWKKKKKEKPGEWKASLEVNEVP